VVFTLDWPGWVKVCRSEGVPFGYNVEPVAVSLYNGEHIEALTLRTAPSVRWEYCLLPALRLSTHRHVVMDALELYSPVVSVDLWKT
jgi:hypothetical protein